MPSMSQWLYMTLLLILVIGCGEPTSIAGQQLPGVEVAAQLPYKSIYGDDSRREVYKSHTQFQEIARESIVALIPSSNIYTTSNGHVRLSSTEYGRAQFRIDDRRMAFCDDVPFQKQPVAAQCTGTLVADDIVLTAAHCLAGKTCEDVSLVFDYYLEDDNKMVQMTSASVYPCQKVLAYEFDGYRDFALLQLSRKTSSDRQPRPMIYTPSKVQKDNDILVVGTPDGLPFKVEAEAYIAFEPEWDEDVFYLYADIFKGNSGSASMNHDGEILGVITRAPWQFYSERKGADCVELTQYNYGTRHAVTSMYAHHILDTYCEEPGASATICASRTAYLEQPDIIDDEAAKEGFVWVTDRLCSNTCRTARNGICNDTSSEPEAVGCALGTDCEDCGVVERRRQIPVYDEAIGLCEDSCRYAGDGVCDDGGPHARFEVCSFGTDCVDCGAR